MSVHVQPGIHHNQQNCCSASCWYAEQFCPSVELHESSLKSYNRTLLVLFLRLVGCLWIEALPFVCATLPALVLPAEMLWVYSMFYSWSRSRCWTVLAPILIPGLTITSHKSVDEPLIIILCIWWYSQFSQQSFCLSHAFSCSKWEFCRRHYREALITPSYLQYHLLTHITGHFLTEGSQAG